MKNQLSKYDERADQMRRLPISIRECIAEVKASMDLGDLIAAGLVVEIEGDFKTDFDAFESVNAVGPLTMVERMIEKEVVKMSAKSANADFP